MPLTGTQHTGTGAAVQLSTITALRGAFKQIDIVSNNGNSANFYIGPSTITTAGANAWIALKPGQSYSYKAVGGVDARERWDLSALYVIGTASDKLHIAQVY